MRIKDEQKQEAIVQSTIELVNEIGFAATSVSKIAKKAGVSPATIYVYYKNKEDLIVSIYMDIKTMIGNTIIQGIDFNQPIRDVLFDVWCKMFRFIKENPAIIQYKEQFANSPYEDLVNHKDLEKAFGPVVGLLQKGIEQKIIKNVNFDIIATYTFFPIFILSNPKHCKNIELTDEAIETAFNLSWDAIKL